MADDTRANITATIDHCERAVLGWRPTPVPTADTLLLRARVLASRHGLDQETALIIAWNDVRDQLALQIKALDLSGKLALTELKEREAIAREITEARRAG